VKLRLLADIAYWGIISSTIILLVLLVYGLVLAICA